MTDTDDDILRDYARARSSAAPGEPVTLIEIGRWRTILVWGRGDTAHDAIELRIGFLKTAEEFFRHYPPTPRELEEAIAAIEDELARARKAVAGDSKLVTTDNVVLEIARIAGVAAASEPILNIEAVEQLYQRFAAIASGAPTTREEAESYAAYAATILILRECMHHLRYASIMVRV